MAKSSNPRLYICIAVIFALICVALIAVILVREISVVSKLQALCGDERKFLNHRFPGYFKTEEEQREFLESLVKNAIPLPDTVGGFSCGFQCFEGGPRQTQPGGNTPARRKRETRPALIYHSCCSSYKNHSSSPAFKDNLSGATRELVHVPDYRQYFTEETCNQVAGCSGCQCAQPEDSVVQAVVWKDRNAANDPDRYELDYLKFGGCCKCLNIGGTN